MRTNVNNILEKNIEALQKYNSSLAERYQQWMQEQFDAEQNCVSVKRTACGDIVITVNKEGYEWYLNSRYDASYAVEQWKQQYLTIHYLSTVFLCGIANGMYLEALLDICGSDNRFIVYEPDVQIFHALMQNVDMNRILTDGRVVLCVDDWNQLQVCDWILSQMKTELIDKSQTIISLNYDKLYPEKLEQFIQLCNMQCLMVKVADNTFIDVGYEFVNNIIMNMWKMAQATSVNIFQKMTQKLLSECDMPAIIVSAGPSLDKNIEDLRNAKNHSLIVAVDSAVRKLLAHDIIPDLIVTVDPHKPMILFQNEVSKQIPVLFCGQSRYDIITEQNGKMIYFAADLFLHAIMTYFGKDVSALETGGSVAHNAFSMVRFLGFHTIIFVGQDLAFTDNKKHASKVYEENGVGEDDQMYAYVEGQNGERLLTFANFALYKEWYENEIRRYPHLHVINATEGGARIYGTEEMSLADAVAQTICQKEVNWRALIDELEPMFHDKELETFYQFLQKQPQRCEELKAYFQDGINQYHRLRELIMQGDVQSKEFAQVSEKIEQINGIDRTEPIMQLLSMYAKEKETTILHNMYEAPDDLNGTVIVAQYGAELLEVYIRHLNNIQNILEILLQYEVKKDIYEIQEYTIVVQSSDDEK